MAQRGTFGTHADLREILGQVGVHRNAGWLYVGACPYYLEGGSLTWKSFWPVVHPLSYRFLVQMAEDPE